MYIYLFHEFDSCTVPNGTLSGTYPGDLGVGLLNFSKPLTNFTAGNFKKQRLLELALNLIVIYSSSSHFSLHIFQLIDCVRLLLTSEAQVDLIDKNGFTPLCSAIAQGHCK